MKTRNKPEVVKKEFVLAGNATSPGIALGPVFVFRPFSINVAELEVKVKDPEKEIELLRDACRRVLEQLEYARASIDRDQDQAEFAEIFESQKAFLSDPVLLDEIHEMIRSSGMSAAFVVSRVLSEKSDHFINLDNQFFRDRAFDIIDIKQKLINSLFGIRIDYTLSTPSIVVAEVLSPTDTVNFNRNLILGFLTDKGGKTSHSAIMARSLRIPSVVNTLNLSAILHKGDYLILDGFSGDVIVNPEKSTIEHYRNLQHSYQIFEQKLQQQKDEPAETRDGVHIELMANVDFTHEVNDVKLNRADGIGLYRTESIFIQSSGNPSEEQQYKIYRKLLQDMAPKPVVIRTVDLGGDKLLEGYGQEEELNPFLGWRAIRFCLDSPDLFRRQLRAILRASAYGKVKLLLPMVCCIREIVETKKIIADIKEDLKGKKINYDDTMTIGVMIETPAAAVSAHALAGYVDFFSIGTNDLTQYVLAIDRTNNKVARSFNTFHPSVLQLMATTIDAANRHKIPVSLCGEFAAVPEAIPLLLGMGLRNFSINPYYLMKVKKVIRSLDIDVCRKLFRRVKKMHHAEEIEETCRVKLREYVTDLEYLS